MRKTVFLLLSLFCLSSYGRDSEVDLHLKEDSTDIDEQRNDIPSFRAEIESGTTVLIVSDRISTFSVSIFAVGVSEPLYQGTTENGVIHITDSLSENMYEIVVENEGHTYSGQIEIE